MISTNDLRPGVCFEYDNEYWQVTEFQHVKPGKGPAFVRVKIKNLRKGGVVERTFRAGEKVQDLRVENRSAQYLYKSGDSFVFMDNESFDQTEIPEERMRSEAGFMVENMDVTLVTCKGEVLGLELPTTIIVKIIKSDPGLKGDTAQGGTKPATIAGGAVIQVPLFVNEGETIKVDPRNGGRYLERANK